MFTHYSKHAKLVMYLFAILLILASMLGITPLSVQAEQVLAAPLSEGVRPPLSEQSASVLGETISAGYHHTCGLKSDGTIVCWGANDYGQSTPPVGTFAQVSAGGFHTCGRKSDGSIACWGTNGYGQITVPAGYFTQISTGYLHTCGLRSDGFVTCWGNNVSGQSSPPPGIFTQVSAGGHHTCGVKSNGTLACWGENSFGQSSPPSGTFTQVSAGYFHTCGIRSDDTLVCWGRNDYDQAMPPTGTFTQISAGDWHTCGLKSDGTIECWGWNQNNQSTPPAGTFTQVSAGFLHTCGVKSDGTPVCWGAGTTITGSDPEYGQSIPPAGVLFGRSQISTGIYHTCGLKSDGTVVCWGLNDDGQSTPPSGAFSQISARSNFACGLKSDGIIVCWGANYSGESTPPSGTFSQISTGYSHACGLKSDGTVACWGSDYSGQSTPPAGTFTQVSAGDYHTCGVKSDGTVACWGAGTTNTGQQPDVGQSIPPSGTFTQISAGLLHTCGLKSNGTVACWGENENEQSTPPSGTFTQISAGSFHSCGLKSDGTIVCWGSNGYGESTPPSGTFTQISVGFTHSCGVKSNSSFMCWGSNDTGQSLPFIISGNVGVAEAILSYDVGGPKTVIADASGNYSLAVSYGWSGAVTPSKPGYIFSPISRTYSNVLANQTNQNYWTSWYGGAVVAADQNVIAVGRPHIGSEVASYDGFSFGSTTMYVPMLFKQMWGSYDSALYIQNTDTVNEANIFIKFYDPDGTLNCTKTDTIPKMSSHGYWLPSESCLPTNWYGGVVVTADRNIVAVGRPHIGNQVMTYNGFASGSLSMYVPMLFKQMWGSYDSAFYVQNTDAVDTANITIDFYDPAGVLSCEKTDTIPPLSSHGYWLPSESCLPANWYGGVVVTSDRNIVAVGRPHIGSEVTTYNGFAAGSTTMYAPMLFKGAYGSYDSALYIQNVDATNTATIAIKFYDQSGLLSYSQGDTIEPGSSKGYWLPDISGLPATWEGSVKVESDYPVVGIARPHLGSSITAYDGFTSGGTSASVPMLFKQMWGSYDSALYMENISETTTANVTVKFYDVNGNLSCVRTDTIPALGVLDYWLPSLTCSP